MQNNWLFNGLKLCFVSVTLPDAVILHVSEVLILEQHTSIKWVQSVVLKAYFTVFYIPESMTEELQQAEIPVSEVFGLCSF